MFNINDAHTNMKDLTKAQAQKWTKTANDEYVTRIGKGARNLEAKHFAIKKANLKLEGKREEKI